MTPVIETDKVSQLVVPTEEAKAQRQEAYEQWKREWDALTEQISAAWEPDKSAAQIISEMRR